MAPVTYLNPNLVLKRFYVCIIYMKIVFLIKMSKSMALVMYLDPNAVYMCFICMYTKYTYMWIMKFTKNDQIHGPCRVLGPDYHLGDWYVYCHLVGGGARSPEKCLRSIDLQKEFIKKMTLDLFGFLTYQAGWGLACITKAGMYVCIWLTCMYMAEMYVYG